MIYLIRHAQAVSPHVAATDSHRYLTDIGRNTARAVGTRLQREGVVLGAILCSPLVRAVQTAELIASALEYPGEIEATTCLMPGAAPEPAARELTLRNVDIAAVGHEPTMSSLGSFLVSRPGFPPFRQGQVCAIRSGQPQWKLHPDTLDIEVLHVA